MLDIHHCFKEWCILPLIKNFKYLYLVKVMVKNINK